MTKWRVTAILTRRSSTTPRDASGPLLKTLLYRGWYRLFEQAIATTILGFPTVRLLYVVVSLPMTERLAVPSLHDICGDAPPISRRLW